MDNDPVQEAEREVLRLALLWNARYPTYETLGTPTEQNLAKAIRTLRELQKSGV